MDANQFFSIANQASPTADVLAQNAPAAAVPSGKTDFANLFNGQMLAQMRQEFAAPVPLQVDLQLVSLGPKMNLITADAPLPDMESLASFARAQGLDENAVRTLFGSSSKSSSTKLTDLLGHDSPDRHCEELGDVAIQVVPLHGARWPGGLAMTKEGELNSGTIIMLTALQDQGQVQGTPDTAAQVLPGVASVPIPVVAIAVAANQSPVSAPSLTANSITVNGPPQTDLLGLSAARTAESPQSSLDPTRTADPLIAYLASVQVSARQQAAVPVTNAAATEQAQHPVAAPMQLAMRVRLDIQNQEITRRLSQMSGSSQKASWAAIAGTGVANEGLTKPWEALPIDVSSAMLSELTDGPLSLISDLAAGFAPLKGGAGDSVRAATPDPASASTAEPLSESALAAQRSAQYQQLADRVGQSLGERLLSQIEKGEWNLKLRLQPESLGRVDVALAMHAGALDASFASDNSMTRDLILQGAGKLRDTLAQSGMAVATVWVGGDQGRKHDGNPTPGRSFKSASGAIRKSDGEPVLGVSSPGRISTAAEGLDVLA